VFLGAPKITVPKIDIPLNIAGKAYLGDAVVDAPTVSEPVAPAAKPTAPAPVVSGADGEVVPIYRTKPKYPRSAARRGLEGVVTISFTITKTGGVRGASVIRATPKNVFDKAALKAIMKWKFQPKLVNGQPVERQATQEIKFKLN